MPERLNDPGTGLQSWLPAFLLSVVLALTFLAPIGVIAMAFKREWFFRWLEKKFPK